MKNFLLLLLLLNGCHYSIRSVSEASPDGPYIFYRNDKIIAKSISQKEGKFFPVSDTVHHRSERIFGCKIDRTEEIFSFSLQQNLRIPPAEYALPDRMLVISDIEGNFEAFRKILQGNGIIDKNYVWTFGEGHLALVGDFFDRGLNVTEILWLIYKLEPEAEKAGGKVHFILGNHEIMNLYGNTKYVENKYLENAKLMDESYKNLFSNDTELGRWLRTKNIIEKIGNFVFVHGGISPQIAKENFSLEKLNQITRENIGRTPKEILSDEGKIIFDTQNGPFWYRGFVKDKLSTNEINKIFEYANCEKIIIGHTVVDDIMALHGGRIIAIDLDHKENLKENFVSALWIERGNFFRVDDKGRKEKIL